ncbi:hypothetical protein R3P38DRAFT_2816717 [Favolaschia claudopus]|uniref:Uncharacterized protein n=1 Tax=Favolaschia claudopus TaxID=2862362 RepID=A0AAV9YYG2_9AGAR
MTVRKNIVGTKYVPNVYKTMAFKATDYESLVSWQGSGISTSTGNRHCVNPNTSIEAIRIQQGNTRAETLSFGKEIGEHTIQQGSVRVNNGMQQDIGELATHSSPLS